MNKEENMEREMDDSFLDKFGKSNLFKVPEGYFANSEDQILSEIKLKSISDNNNYSVPEGYFDTLSDKITGQIAINELAKTNSFNVPDSYFENLTDAIINKTITKPSARIINFNFAKYAAAAVLLVVTSFGAVTYFNSSTSISKQLANLPEDEITEYLNFYTDANDMPLIIEASDEDLSEIEENLNKILLN